MWSVRSNSPFFLHDRIGRLENRATTQMIRQRLHDRIGRLEIVLELLQILELLHDRIGRLEI